MTTTSLTIPAESLSIRPWPDPVIDLLGHDPRSAYVERFWLGVLGPSTTWLMRRLASGLETAPAGKDPATCFQCHLDIHAEFNLPQHHPVMENRMNCVQCHDPHGSDIMKPRGGLAMARLNENCAQCHREQARPFVFEHEALREGCTICHTPHGSINPKLLVQRDANLCLKCHAQTQSVSGRMFIGKQDHSSFVPLGACWSAGCHPAIHGSNTSRRMHY